ncbi:MAG: stage III sporulation protein AF [Clostridiales bacterium]|nr:stage III sporulation protein AF [Clostridiales bacterium]
MGQLYQWVKNIVIYMIVNAIITNLLGDSSYKKYVSMVSGLILVLLVVSPLLDLLSMDDRFDFLFRSNNFAVETAEFKNTLQRMEENQRQAIFEEYEVKIEKQVRESLQEDNIVLSNFNVEFQDDIDKSGFGEILRINIKGEYKAEDRPAFNNGVEPITIDPIVIEFKEKENSEKIPSPIEINIKNKLSDFYNIKPDNININIQGG